VVLLGYLIFFLTIRENSYAARVVEVDAGQKVIETGPYVVVRHPMYLGTILIFLATPLALGSFWAFFAFLPVPALIILRIRNEEEVLVRNCPGTRSTGRRRAIGWCPGGGEGGGPLRSLLDGFVIGPTVFQYTDNRS